MTDQKDLHAKDSDAEPTPATENVEPVTDLERALLEGQQGTKDQADVILAFLNSEVFIVSAQDPAQNPEENIDPVALEGPNSTPMLAVFSHESRIPAEVSEQAPYALGVFGHTVVSSVGEAAGIMLNPGFEIGFMIEPEGVAQIRNDFRPAEEVEAMRQAEANAQAGSEQGPTPGNPAPSVISDTHPVRATNDPAGF